MRERVWGKPSGLICFLPISQHLTWRCLFLTQLSSRKSSKNFVAWKLAVSHHSLHWRQSFDFQCWWEWPTSCHSCVPLAKKMQFKPKPYCFEDAPCGRPRQEAKAAYRTIPTSNTSSLCPHKSWKHLSNPNIQNSGGTLLKEGHKHGDDWIQSPIRLTTDSTTIYYKTCAHQTRLCIYNCRCLFCVSAFCFWNHKAPERLPDINAYSTVIT